jgi:hypothetical protein
MKIFELMFWEFGETAMQLALEIFSPPSRIQLVLRRKCRSVVRAPIVRKE